MKKNNHLYYYLILISCFFFYNCNEVKTQQSMAHNFYVGTYTGGASEGIYQYALSDDGKLTKIGLKARANNPSFLALDKKRRTRSPSDRAFGPPADRRAER